MSADLNARIVALLAKDLPAIHAVLRREAEHGLSAAEIRAACTHPESEAKEFGAPGERLCGWCGAIVKLPPDRVRIGP